MQGWLGLLGTGLVILLLVVLGNPGSGGIYAPEFLPAALRGMHRWNVPGLATDLIKSAVYFDRRSARWPLAGLLIWTALGLLGLLTAALFRERRADRPARADREWLSTSIVGKVTHRTPSSRAGPRGYHPGSRTALSFVLT